MAPAHDSGMLGFQSFHRRSRELPQADAAIAAEGWLLVTSHLVTSHLVTSHLVGAHLVGTHLVRTHLVRTHFSALHFSAAGFRRRAAGNAYSDADHHDRTRQT